MSVNVSEFIQILLTVGWRRRLLILFPITIFIGISVLASTFFPRTYISRTLIMLQEGQAADPLNYGSGAAQRTQLRKAEVETLLKSERVLRGAVLDFNLGKKPLTPKQIEDEIKDLRDDIQVGVVGREFISVELHAGYRVGLADSLSIIMTRFFERLFSREDAMKTARQFAYEQRKRDLQHAEKALTVWFERHGSAIVNENIKADIEKIAALRKRRAQSEEQLIEAASAVLTGPIELTNVAATLAQARQFRFGTVGQGVDERRSERLRELDALFQNYETVNRSLVSAQRSAITRIEQGLKAAQLDNAPLYQELRRVEARFNESVDQYSAHQAQANKSRAPTLPPFGLINPELIRIIDEPRDPVSPATSILKILLACLAAGIGLGVGLAALAEQIDDTLYDARDLGRLTGVDVVIQLPMLDPNMREIEMADNTSAVEPTSLARANVGT